MNKLGLSICGEVNILPAQLGVLNRFIGDQKAFLHIYRDADKTLSGFMLQNAAAPNPNIVLEKLFIGFAFEKFPLSFLVTGKMLLTLENLPPLLFLLECSISADRCFIEGYLENVQQRIVLFQHFTVTELGVILGFGDSGLLLGLLGGFQVKQINVRGFAACGIGETLKPAAFMAAFPEMRLSSLVELFTGEPSELFTNFDFLSIENFDTTVHLDMELEGLETSEIVNSVNRCITDPEWKLSDGDTHIRPLPDGKLIIDLKNSRSYELRKQAERGYDLCLPPQFYVNCTGSRFHFGKYYVPPGSFICATVTVLGARTGVFFQIGEEGLTLYQRIEPINLRWVKLSSSKSACPEIDKLSAVTQFLPSGCTGPVLYLRLSQHECEAFLDARLEILSIFDLSAKIFFRNGQVQIDYMMALFRGLTNVRFKVDAGYNSFAASEFKILLRVELANFEETFKSCLQDVSNMPEAVALDGLYQEYSALENQFAALNRLAVNGHGNSAYGMAACKESLALAKSGIRTAAAIMNERNYKSLSYLKKIEIEADVGGFQNGLRAQLTVDFVLGGRPHSLKAGFHFDGSSLADLLKSKIFELLRAPRDEIETHLEGDADLHGFDGSWSPEEQNEAFKRFMAAEEDLLASSAAEGDAWLIENYFMLDALEQQHNALREMLAAENLTEHESMNLPEQISLVKEELRRRLYTDN